MPSSPIRFALIICLHQLGVDHRSLTFSFQGLDQRLTGVEEAHVVKKILS